MSLQTSSAGAFPMWMTMCNTVWCISIAKKLLRNVLKYYTLCCVTFSCAYYLPDSQNCIPST